MILNQHRVSSLFCSWSNASRMHFSCISYTSYNIKICYCCSLRHDFIVLMYKSNTIKGVHGRKRILLNFGASPKILASFGVSEFSSEDMRIAFREFKPKSTVGPYGIPAFLVKDCAAVFLQPLEYIFNKIIRDSKFPSVWKISWTEPWLLITVQWQLLTTSQN